ncbi:Creatinase/aminopeptidase [Metschnikowia bicuspidata]|uniref:Xaa-Pro aminopeptidase n=1 Tax=Metschnikowia bicuspidata TaxID=27322 RepID=A0A4P9ZG66_9ASCO|nr:Creatinase/aminopeptidase [Metschnikowia bicuspidata]
MRTANKNVTRANCKNCTCSPGLLSRNKRSMLMAKRINIKRTGSGSPGASRHGSILTLDATSLCLPETKAVNTSDRLAALRKTMAESDVAVYIVPSEDEHQSEYVAPLDQRRNFISGFSGSSGTVIVTRDVTCMNDVPEGQAALATDGRYFNQATNELDFNWTLLKQGIKCALTWEKWAVQQAVQMSIDSGYKISIGVDPKLISYLTYERIQKTIEEELVKSTRASIDLVPVRENLIDKIWLNFEELPESSHSLIKKLDLQYAGESAQDKIAKVAEKIKENNAYGLVVSALDEVAWLLNLRGSDIQYNPVFYSYAVVTSAGDVTLYADYERFDSTVSSYLSDCKVAVKPYLSFWSNIVTLSKEFSVKGQSFILDTGVASWEIVRLLKCKYQLVSPSPIEDLKAIKNETELRGAHNAHLKDGRALVKFFAWLESQIVLQSELVDEVDADEHLTTLRRQEKDFVGLSFDTICATGANGAIIHYKPFKGTCKTIDPSKIYLCDSGAQYLDGTTDTTRTVHMGTPTADEIKNYTLVLKGHLALGNLKFPEHTTGNVIDSIARQYLWQYGLDYGHGTSHGIGLYLNVHEGPIGIGPRPTAAKNALKPGHLISNEPGYYSDGNYGIRIENVMLVKESGMSYNGRKFLEFETVTVVPYCRRLIDVKLLTAQEIKWVNEYHQQIWDKLGPSFEKTSLEYMWLKRETSPL